jgi:hypothetical protein
MAAAGAQHLLHVRQAAQIALDAAGHGTGLARATRFATSDKFVWFLVAEIGWLIASCCA